MTVPVVANVYVSVVVPAPETEFCVTAGLLTEAVVTAEGGSVALVDVAAELVAVMGFETVVEGSAAVVAAATEVATGVGGATVKVVAVAGVAAAALSASGTAML